MAKPQVLPELESLIHPIDEYHVLEGNPNKGSVEGVGKSLERFKQRKPIVARPDGTIIAGNHTYLAAKELGWDGIAVVHTEEEPMAESKGFAAADNRTRDLATTDNEALADMIAEIRTFDEDLLAAASYTIDDLDMLLGDPLNIDDVDLPNMDEMDDMPREVFGVMIDCDNENERDELLEILKTEGYSARPVG